MLIYVKFFFVGALIGVGTGIPIGPVNVAVIDAAFRHTLRRGIAVGLGGAIADGLYAALGIVGVGPYLDDNPEIQPYLYAVSGAVLLVYGALTARTRPIPAVEEVKERAAHPSGQMWSGFWLGVALILLNPAAIVTWVLIVGTALPGLSLMEGTSATIGVTFGSFAWFVLVAYLANHGKKLLGGKAIWITRVVGYLLVAYGLYSLGRASHSWLF